MLNLLLGGTGTGKSEVLAQRILAEVERGGAVTAIIPDQFSFEFDKKLYKSLGVQRYNEISTFSFARLAEDIFHRYGSRSGEYANETMKIALMQMALARLIKAKSLDFYSRQAKSATFLKAALEMVKELHWSGITAVELAEKLPILSENVFGKTSDILLIMTEYNRILAERGFKDSLTDITEGAQVAAVNDFFKGRSIFLDEFWSFSFDELTMLETAISSAKDVTIALSLSHDGLTGSSAQLFSLPRNTYLSLRAIAEKYNVKISEQWQEKAHRFATPMLEFMSENIFRPATKSMKSDGSVRVYEAPEPYTEGDFVCTEIKKLLTSGYKLGEIAIVSRQMGDYADILESAFSRYEIPFFMDRRESVVHKSVILLLTSAIDIAAKRAPDTEAILRYAKTGLLGIPSGKIALLENYCFHYGVEGQMWAEPFPADSGSCEELRAGIITPLLHFKNAAKGSGRDICKAVFMLFDEIKLSRNIAGIASSQEDVEKLSISRERKQLWNLLVELFETLHSILGDEPMTLRAFRELLTLLLGDMNFASPPQTLDAVVAADAERARFSSPKIVFAMGANDGFFPLGAKAGGLFGDRDKAELDSVGLHLMLTTDRQSELERFITYTALSAPSERLYVTYPMADGGGRVRFPSQVISQFKRFFVGEIVNKTADLGQLYFCTTGKAAYYTYVQGYNKNNADSATLRAFLEESDYAGKLQNLDQIAVGEREKIDDTAVARRLFGEKLTVSASRFEDFNRCPFMYFCRKGLGLYPPTQLQISGAEQGTAIHKCMYEMLKNYDRDDFVAAESDELSVKIKCALDDYYTEKLGGDFGKTARFLAVYDKLQSTVLEILLHLQEEFAQGEFYPTDFELKIADGGEASPIRLKTAGGQEISFIGIIDRVDSLEKNGKTYVRVVDYKSGEKTFRLEDILYGLNLQMLLYLFTITGRGGDGRYCDALPAGVLYMPSKDVEAALARAATEKEQADERNKTLKMQGILLDDDAVIAAMERDVAGVYIPVKLSNGGYTKASKLIGAAQFERLRRYSEELLIAMAERLGRGEIEAVPLAKKNARPCAYCDYWSICGKNTSPKVREYAADAAEQVEKILNGVEGIGQQLDPGTT